MFFGDTLEQRGRFELRRGRRSYRAFTMGLLLGSALLLRGRVHPGVRKPVRIESAAAGAACSGLNYCTVAAPPCRFLQWDGDVARDFILVPPCSARFRSSSQFGPWRANER